MQLRSFAVAPSRRAGATAAEIEADQSRVRLIKLRAVQARAAWLAQRPQLGRDVFARGQPEIFGVAIEARRVALRRTQIAQNSS